MSLVDAQALPLVMSTLAGTLNYVQAEGMHTVERYRDAIALIHWDQAFEPEPGQKAYALTYVLISEDRAYVQAVAEQIGKTISTDL